MSPKMVVNKKTDSNDWTQVIIHARYQLKWKRRKKRTNIGFALREKKKQRQSVLFFSTFNIRKRKMFFKHILYGFTWILCFLWILQAFWMWFFSLSLRWNTFVAAEHFIFLSIIKAAKIDIQLLLGCRFLHTNIITHYFWSDFEMFYDYWIRKRFFLCVLLLSTDFHYLCKQICGRYQNHTEAHYFSFIRIFKCIFHNANCIAEKSFFYGRTSVNYTDCSAVECSAAKKITNGKRKKPKIELCVKKNFHLGKN